MPTASCSSTSRPGVTSHDVVAQIRRRLGKGVKVGHAGTLDPFATGLLLIGVGRGTRIQRFLMELPKRYETVARLGFTSTTGDPEGEIAPGTMPPDELRAADGPHHAAPAGLQRGEDRGQARLRAGPRRGRMSRCPSARSRSRVRAAVARARPRGLRDRVLLGHLRALADRRPATTPTASSCAAPTSAASTSPTPMRSGSSASTTRSTSCPRSTSTAKPPARRPTA